MSARHVAGAVVLTLVGLPLGADNAQARGGGSGSSASSGQHHQGGGGGSSSSSSSSSGSSGSSYSRGSSGGGGGGSAQNDAQRRHPRPGTGHGSYRSHGYYYSPYYYRPYSYGYYGYYPSWYWGYYDNPYYYGGYRSPYYYGGGYRSGDVGSLRLLVDPSEARVYVDGYYAGAVDDFDGLFQRLNLTRGRHELAFKLEGYRTYRMRVYVPSDQTLKIHYDMVKGTGEDVREEAVGSPDDDRNDDRWARRERDRDEDDAEEDDDRGRAPVREPRRESEADRAPARERQPESEEAAPRPSGGRGMLLLQVEPPDASVYVDGEFRGAARQARSLELTEGRHRVEVVRPGYKPVEREIEIRAGRSENWEVSLGRP